MSASRIPYRRLVSIDERLELAAAKPVIVPDTVVIDHGKVFLSEVFLRAADTLGHLGAARPTSRPTDKAIIERTFGSINTLFCQHVAGYTGRDVTRRGTDVADRAVGRSPTCRNCWMNGSSPAGSPGRTRACAARSRRTGRLRRTRHTRRWSPPPGYLPVALTGEDYIELLPAQWRASATAGSRSTTAPTTARDLAPYRRLSSGLAAREGRWEVHYVSLN